MRSRHAPLAAAFAATVALACWIGCSSSSSDAAPATCNADPIQCARGTTCWPTSGTGSSLALTCLQSNPAISVGAPCEDSIGLATCGDGMTCDVTGTDASAGVCTYYCSIERGLPCAPGYQCRITHVGGEDGPAIELCRKGSSSAGDGGGSDPGTVPPGYLPDGGFDPNFDASTDSGKKPF